MSLNQVRQGPAAGSPPTLALGELGMTTDTFVLKVGRGAVAWTSLPHLLQSDESISALGAATGDLSLGGHKITSLADPVAGTDAATRQWTLAQITALINAAPGALDTLGELAAQMQSDEGALVTSLAGKASTTHAATHASAGSDPVSISQSQVVNLPTDLAAKGDAATGLTVSVDGELAVFNGTGGKTLKRGTGTGTARVDAGVHGVNYGAVMMTAATPLSSSTADTTLWTPALVPFASLVAGQTMFRVRMGGTVDYQATSGLLNCFVKANGSKIGTVAVISISQTSSGSGINWWADLDVYIESAGSASTVSSSGTDVGLTTAGAGINPRAIASSAGLINLTTGLQFTITGQWATSSASNIFRLIKASITQIT